MSSRLTSSDHCLEYWREAAMCRGDATMATMFWRDAVPTSRAWSDHEYINWDAFDKWARSRSLNMTDPSILNQTGRFDWISTPDGRTVLRSDPTVRSSIPKMYNGSSKVISPITWSYSC